jgi:hypothetical protein
MSDLRAPTQPVDTITHHFREADLNVLGQSEAGVHGRQSHLLYGLIQSWDDGWRPYHPYILPLSDLKNLPTSTVPWKYYPLNGFTEAKKTWTGGLEVRRKASWGCDEGHNTAVLSRSEYTVLRQYL